MEDLTQKTENNSLDLSDVMKNKLLATSKIGKVLAILIVLKMVLSIIGFSATIFAFGSLIKGISVVQTTMAYSFVALVVTLVICFFLLKYLYKFTVCVEKGLKTDNANFVEESFGALKSFLTLAVVFVLFQMMLSVGTSVFKILMT